ncbi:MAG: tetratricopeptide repeat protein [Candidatus Gastranaerophilaceae bacterium]
MKTILKIFLIVILLSSSSFSYCFSKELEASSVNAIYYNKTGIEYYVNNDFEKAEKYFKKAVELDFDYPQAQNNLANVLYKQGNFTQAIQILEKLIVKKPDYTDSYINLALIYRKNDDATKELQYLNQAITINPDSYKAHLQRGITFCRLSQDEKAKEDFLNASEINPNSAESFINIGQVFLKQHEYYKSLEYFNKSCVIDEKYASACLKNLVEKNPQRAIYHYYYSKYLQSSKNYQKASVEFENAIQIQPSQLDDYLDIAFIYSDQKMYDFFYKTLKEGLEKYPDNISLANQLTNYNEMQRNKIK